jgi:membrane protease YdiL (CAAX protease family)
MSTQPASGPAVTTRRPGLLLLAQVLLACLVANFLPHVVVLALTGQLYFALPPVPGILAELSIMSLNLILPWMVVRANLGPTGSIRQALAWRWFGWQTLAWALLGLAGLWLMFIGVNWLIGSPPFPYGGGVGPLTLPRDAGLVSLVLALWWVTTLGEEIMFRGFVQGQVGQRYGALAGLLAGALLFALRHLPADLYWGWDAPGAQWLSRALQLGLSALILGWLRHHTQSTMTTWVTHLLLWLSVVFYNAAGGT